MDHYTDDTIFPSEFLLDCANLLLGSMDEIRKRKGLPTSIQVYAYHQIILSGIGQSLYPPSPVGEVRLSDMEIDELEKVCFLLVM